MDQAPEHKPLKSRWRRAVNRSFLAVLLVFILVVAIWEVTGCRALDQAIEQARAVDSRLTIEEIEASRKTWPDKENGALVLSDLLGPLAALNKSASIDSLPMIGCGGDDPVFGHSWPEDVDRAVASKLEELALDLNIIDRLADIEGGRFPLPTTEPMMPDEEHTSGLRMAAKLEDLQAIQHAMRNDNAGAIRAVQTMAGINRLLADEPMLISSLVHTAIDSLMVRTIEFTCSLTEFSESELGELEQLVTAGDVPERLTWGMLGERAQAVRMYDKFQNQTHGMAWVPGIRGMILRDKALGLEYLSGLVKASKHPEQTLVMTREAGRRLDTLPRYALLTGILAPSLDRAFVLDTRSLAQLRAARIALAIERYRFDRRLWPKRLEELVPDYLEAIPADPFKDQPMSYLVDDGTVVVYSIGEDEKDNNGDVTHHRATDEDDPTDFGFVLLPPEQRNRPPLPSSMPTTQP